MDGLSRRDYGDATADRIDTAVQGLVQRAYDKAHAALSSNRSLLEESGRLLLAKETLDEEELRPLFAKLEVPQFDAPSRGTALS